MKTDVISWRVSADLKTEIEHAARVSNVPVSIVLSSALREWLDHSAIDPTAEEKEQRRLHAVAERSFGVLSGGNPDRSASVRSAVRERLQRRRGVRGSAR